MKVSLKDVKIGEKIKVELKPIKINFETPNGSFDENAGVSSDLALIVSNELGLQKYEGELIDVQDNLFALKNGETILIFDTDLYEIFDDSKKGCLVINLSFEGKDL